ncbi:10958_t:CDS:10 [Entrophospora sp. SA101]|nr:10958_t:CDS:10 [Entrophospora sp. SA101]
MDEDYEDYSTEILEETIKELDNSTLALGGFEQVGDKKIYKPGIQYLGNCLKDLKQYIRNSGDLKNDILLELGHLNTLRKDLIPIFLLNCDDVNNQKKLLRTQICIELFFLLTEPVDPIGLKSDVFEETVEYRDTFAKMTKIRNFQVDYKLAFIENPKVIESLAVILVTFLSQNDDEEVQILQLLVILMSEKDEIHLNTIVLEIFYHIFLSSDAKDLFNNPKLRCKELLEQENRKKAESLKNHSQFSGAVWIEMPNGEERILHKREAFCGKLFKALNSNKSKKVSKQKPQDGFDNRKLSNLTYKKDVSCLLEVAINILKNGFNDLMVTILKGLEHGRIDRPEPIEYDFNEIVELLTTRAFSLVIRIMRMLKEKKMWLELHFGIECFKQMLFSLNMLSASSDENDRDIAYDIQDDLYYEKLNLDFVFELAKDYKDQSFGYYESVVGLVDVLMDMLESYSKKSKDEEAYGDERFDFREFEENFSTDSVITHYIDLLEEIYKDETKSTIIIQILKLFNRICSYEQSYFLFFRVKFIKLLYCSEEYYRNVESLRGGVRTELSKTFRSFNKFIMEKIATIIKKNENWAIENLNVSKAILLNIGGPIISWTVAITSSSLSISVPKSESISI